MAFIYTLANKIGNQSFFLTEISFKETRSEFAGYPVEGALVSVLGALTEEELDLFACPALIEHIAQVMFVKQHT